MNSQHLKIGRFVIQYEDSYDREEKDCYEKESGFYVYDEKLNQVGSCYQHVADAIEQVLMYQN